MFHILSLSHMVFVSPSFQFSSPLAPLLAGSVEEGHRGHPDHALLRLQQRVLVILALEIVKLNPRILPREIHKLLGFENSIHFVNEKNSGDVNIDLNQNFVRDCLVQWRRLFVLQHTNGLH